MKTAGAFVKIQIRDFKSGNVMEYNGANVVKTLNRARSDYIRKYEGD